MILNVISTRYRRTAIGMVVLGALLSFALGQQVGHGRTATFNVARTHNIPAVSAHTSGAIGTLVPQTIKTSPTDMLSTSAAYQGGHTEQKHGHGHGKGDSLVTLVTTSHSQGNGDHSSHKGDGNSQND